MEFLVVFLVAIFSVLGMLGLCFIAFKLADKVETRLGHFASIIFMVLFIALIMTGSYYLRTIGGS